ncbi:mortality factor 4-like protein 1 isoform X2 [Parasteatoda tepidariorum]|uniref:mortality factor 4-like protein 1 isoform X2 n=1 Tax=Parasteatoda tepidariorum TaxID=114398 RepID=UPI00077F8841|nr:mortality factor 4-like protein 1 isoform X2 [Parasteatoda tepidariorum]
MCLKSQLRDKHMKYFIHYSGWNKNWDEWVPECRVLKYNDANLQKQKELTRTHMKSKKSKNVKLPVKSNKEPEKDAPAQSSPVEKSKPKPEKCLAPSPVPEPSSSSESPPSEFRKKKKAEACFIEEVEPEKEIKIEMPPLLRNWLVDDWDLITRQKKILHLPSRITVNHIIASYVKEKVSVKGLSQSMESSIVLFANTIRDCFNVALGKMLLWKFERPAYAEMLAEYPESSMCEIYGAIHLLRMFTKVGSLLTGLSSERNALTSLLVQMEDFVRYIAQNPSFFSLNDYVVASPEYHRRAL